MTITLSASAKAREVETQAARPATLTHLGVEAEPERANDLEDRRELGVPLREACLGQALPAETWSSSGYLRAEIVSKEPQSRSRRSAVTRLSP